MNKIITFLSIVSILALTACGTTQVLKPVEKYSDFDNRRTVYLPPHGNIPNSYTDMFISGIGAFWSDASPDILILDINIFNQWTEITEANLNIDGEIIALQKISGKTHLTDGGGVKKSNQTFHSNLQTIESIINSKKTWLQVYTSDGIFEHGVINGEKDSKAYNALKGFLMTVKKDKRQTNKLTQHIPELLMCKMPNLALYISSVIINKMIPSLLTNPKIL